jgi:cellobiose phosphorylase
MSDKNIYDYQNEAGLRVSIATNGSIQTIEADPVRVSLHAATPLQSSAANIYLRLHGDEILSTPILGPASSGSLGFGENFTVRGKWMGLEYTCRLLLSPVDTAWLWDVAVTNREEGEKEVDLVYVQDVGLTGIPAGGNELYTSQYVDYEVLEDENNGQLLCCRQVQHGPGCKPWLMMGSAHGIGSVLSEGLDFYGPLYRETGEPKALKEASFGGARQQEISITALQEKPFVLAGGDTTQRGFCALLQKDHPERTTAADAAAFAPALAAFDNLRSRSVAIVDRIAPVQSLFSRAPLFAVDDLTETELTRFFGKSRRNADVHDGKLLSFFADDQRHIALRGKEAIVDRPHAHIMQTSDVMVPDNSHMTSTTFMYGVFNSHVSQGNSQRNALFSLNTHPLNFYRFTGQRIFVKLDGVQYQLGVPSAYEISVHGTRWLYKQGKTLIQVRSWATVDQPILRMDITVLEGAWCEFVITSGLYHSNNWQVAINETAGTVAFKLGEGGIKEVFPNGGYNLCVNNADDVATIGGDELLFDDAQSRGLEYVVIKTNAVKNFGLSIIGDMAEHIAVDKCGKSDDASWELEKANTANVLAGLDRDIKMDLGNVKNPELAESIQEIIPWYLLNAQAHYLTPHGSEQPAGGAWGTRDTNQGPLELLIAAGRFREARIVLSMMFSNQESNGNWPQWWAFDNYRSMRADESHGDVKFWPILALSQYIAASNDIAFLDELLPFSHVDGSYTEEKTTLREHVSRVIDYICNTFVAGTHLTAYEDGDWNDSMQPTNQNLKDRLTSSWTVGLNYQAFRAYENVCRQAGDAAQAEKIDQLCRNMQEDFNRYLIKDDTVAGYGIIEEDGSVRLLLHPTDEETNIQYRLLPMIRGVISGIFTAGQAEHHLALIEKHLKGPDGARLMNRPPKYRGGLQTYFQRAESSPFFGREIGIMYTHAHLRYTESQARAGRADHFIKAMRQCIPVGINKLVPCTDIRQANCYYSSSDAAVRNRYEADEHYQDILDGKVTLRGGWRMYSSGPGIYVGLILTKLVGLRYEFGKTILDPVIPTGLSGLKVALDYCGKRVEFEFLVETGAAGPQKVEVNGKEIAFEREENPYRTGGAVIGNDMLMQALDREHNRIHVVLG